MNKSKYCEILSLIFYIVGSFIQSSQSYFIWYFYILNSIQRHEQTKCTYIKTFMVKSEE